MTELSHHSTLPISLYIVHRLRVFLQGVGMATELNCLNGYLSKAWPVFCCLRTAPGDDAHGWMDNLHVSHLSYSFFTFAIFYLRAFPTFVLHFPLTLASLVDS